MLNKTLSTWQTKAFNDITWSQDKISTKSGFKITVTKYFPSLKSPDSNWLMYYMETGSMPWSGVKITLDTSSDKVQFDVARNVLNSDTSLQVKVNDGNVNTFEKQDRVWLLKNGNQTIATWNMGEESKAIGDADGPHYYAKLTLDAELLADILVPSVFTYARFIHQPLVPLLKDVPENLSAKQSEILFSFLALQLYLM